MGTMRQTVMSIALVAIAGVHETKASPIDYQLQLYNIDDDASVTISGESGVTYSNIFPGLFTTKRHSTLQATSLPELIR